MLIGEHEGKKVYGPRPTPDEVANSAKWRRLDIKLLRPALELASNGRYYVEVWALPVENPVREVVGWNYKVDPVEPVYEEHIGYRTFRTRRDGRVEGSHGAVAAKQLVLL